MARMLAVRRSKDGELGGMAPMLDLLFIIALFFVLATMIEPEAAIETAIEPLSSLALPKDEPVILVKIDEKGEVYLDGQVKPLELRFLRSRLEPLVSASVGATLDIQAHPSVPSSMLAIIESIGETSICFLPISPDSD